MSNLRPELQVFSEAMEDKLKQKDHRGGWHECSIDFLTYRLREEQAELFNALRLYYMYPSEDTRNRVQEECVDIANFAMMISDLVGKK